MSIGEKIREARELCHLKQAELAEKIDANTVTVSRWERNINVPNSTALKKIAAALNTTVAYLSGETDDPARSAPAAEPKKLEEHPQIKTEDKGVLVYEANGQKLQVPATPEYAAQFWAWIDKMIGKEK